MARRRELKVYGALMVPGYALWGLDVYWNRIRLIRPGGSTAGRGAY
jgi:hypothetical protein